MRSGRLWNALRCAKGWQGKPFSRKDVNERLSKAEYLDLMHQQW